MRFLNFVFAINIWYFIGIKLIVPLQIQIKMFNFINIKTIRDCSCLFFNSPIV